MINLTVTCPCLDCQDAASDNTPGHNVYDTARPMYVRLFLVCLICDESHISLGSSYDFRKPGGLPWSKACIHHLSLCAMCILCWLGPRTYQHLLAFNASSLCASDWVSQYNCSRQIFPFLRREQSDEFEIQGLVSLVILLSQPKEADFLGSIH